ncbi:MAG: hypothetical protein FJX23_09165 [Alphaproteobacteria bacterium]|nr:hypothetical protein [Alphaproteobacteria bacterium]
MTEGKVSVGMFHRINDFAFARNERQAVGFGLFHLLVVLLGLSLALVVYGLLFGFESFANATERTESFRNFSNAIVMLEMGYIGYLSYQILAAKNRLSDLRSALAGVVGIVLTGGALVLGLLVVSGLTILRPLPSKTAGDANEGAE